MPQWTADIELGAGLAAQLIAAQFPEFAGTRVAPLGTGWDNAAFLVDERVVFRFPRRKVAVELIEREVALLPAIAPHVPLRIPAPAYIGAPSPEYPWRFAGYARIAGATACSRTLSAHARARLAEPLAGFLRALHAIDPKPLVAAGLPRDEIGRLDHRKRSVAIGSRLPGLVAAGLLAEGDELLAWLAAHPPQALPPERLRVVHGDLYARHVLVDDAANVTGIIDWGDVHLGDPAIDLAIAHLMLPPSALRDFRAAYGPIDERSWNVARYRAIYHAILEIDYGLKARDAGMCEIGKIALGFLRGRS